MSNKKKILVIQKVHDKGMELINNHPDFDVEVTDDVSVENLKAKIKDCDGASIRIAKLPGEVINEAKNLKIISRHGVGYDNIDLKTAKERDIKIAITANANAVTVACAAEVITDIFARGISLARIESAGVDEALKTVTVEAFIASTALGAVSVVCAFSINIARIGRSTDVNVASSRISPG